MFNNLPEELKCYLLRFVPFPSLLMLHNVNHQWRRLTVPRLDIYWQKASATITVDCGRSHPALIEMTLSPPAPSGRGLKPVNSVNYEPTAARILGPNHYQIRDHDVKYRLLKLSFTFGGQFDQCPQYKHELMLDSPVFLQFRQALIQLGAENSWALIYELNAFRSGHADAHFRPWLLSGLTRDDIIKQDTMTRFFVPRTLRVSYSLLANIALVQQDVITRRIKGSHHSLIE